MKRFALLMLIVLLSGCSAAEVATEEVLKEVEVIVEVPVEVIREVPVEVPVEVVVEVPTGGVDVGDIPLFENRKIIYTADLDVNTGDLDSYYDLVKHQVSIHGGYFQYEYANDKKLDLTVRVPSHMLDNLLSALKDGGEVVNFSKRSEDVTNSYSIYEARKEALEAKHARIVQLISEADKIEDIIKLESERDDVETELLQIGIQLTNYDSLVEFSTINLDVFYVNPVVVVVTPDSTIPELTFSAADTESIEFEIKNRDDEDLVILHAKVYLEDALVYSEQITVYPLTSEPLLIEGLKSDTTYKLEYYATQEEHNDTVVFRQAFTTQETFGDEIGNNFERAWTNFGYALQSLVLFFVGALPTLLVLTVIGIPASMFAWKHYKKNRK